MSSLALRKDRATSPPQFDRHKPEQTLLYQVIEQHYPAFSCLMEQQGRLLPFHVKKESDDFLTERGFFRPPKISERPFCGNNTYLGYLDSKRVIAAEMIVMQQPVPQCEHTGSAFPI